MLHATGDRNRFAQQLFAPLPGRYDRLAEVLSLGQNGRWRRAMVDHIVPTAPRRVLDVASGTAGVAQPTGREGQAPMSSASTSPSTCCERGRSGPRRRFGRSDPAHRGAGGADALPGRRVRRPDLHLPAAVRGRPRKPPSASWPGWCKPGGGSGEPGVSGAPPVASGTPGGGGTPVWSFPVAGLITGGPSLVSGRPLSGPNISGHYRKYPLPLDRGGLA